MGRRPIGKKAMTAAERQQRVRKRQKKEKLATGRKAIKQRAQLKSAEAYIPTPPGITYWHELTLLTDQGERTIWQPRTRPLAAMKTFDLSGSDIIELLRFLKLEAHRRGLREPTDVSPPDDDLARLSWIGGGVMCCTDPPETWTVISDRADETVTLTSSAPGSVADATPCCDGPTFAAPCQPHQ